MDWVLIAVIVAIVLCTLAAAWVIVEWVWSDTPGKRRPWETRKRPPEE